MGAEAGLQFGPLMIDLRCKIALGQMHQAADVDGATDVLNPDGSMTFFRGGGLYALRSNIGRHQRNELAFIPEVGLNAGIQLTRHLKLFVGYSFLWISTVARAGEQIDPVINVSQFPIRSGDGPLACPAGAQIPLDRLLGPGVELRTGTEILSQLHAQRIALSAWSCHSP